MPNYTPVIPKYNPTSGVVPAVGELEYGELAVNIEDGNLYTKKLDDTIVNINTGVGSNLVVDWNNLSNVPTTFSPASHSHAISDVTNLQTALDNKQAAGSYAASVHTHNPTDITGTAIVEGDSRLTDSRSPTAHNHGIDEIFNLQNSLDNKADSYHSHSETGYDENIEGTTAVGLNALEYIRNNSVATNALLNTAIGFNALENSYGENNTAVGSSSLRANEDGINNTSVGTSALVLNVSGTRNVAVGSNCAINTTTGNGNIVIGFDSAPTLTTGFGNTIIGNSTAEDLTVGSDNVVIGKDIEFQSGLLNGVIAIGSYAVAQRSNELVLGASSAALITSTTVGNAGSSASLPSNPLGYLEVRLNGTVVKIPYYNS